jgi:hypothetical protein
MKQRMKTLMRSKRQGLCVLDVKDSIFFLFFSAVSTRTAGEMVGGTYVPVCSKFNHENHRF